ncbi:hypothetical protein [Streptomyces inhibens]|uniref:hypothetical protein n=1 Tax=Streptomyces inhibens TaxID=2293571 RepID=UPI001EE6C2BB|nr:hypothetical protein [Streptomyces inhibens]UKY54044.1 hypothetical protein KI385_38055 [Streptomyces inhibens]
MIPTGAHTTEPEPVAGPSHAPDPAPAPVPPPRPALVPVPAPLRVPHAHERARRSPRWRSATTEYEQRLGVALERAAAVRRVAQLAVLRLASVLGQEFTPERAAGAFFKDDSSSAGQVGTAGDLGVRLRDACAPGSGATVRQLMTAFYNAAYYKYGQQAEKPDDEREVSFKTLLHRVVLDGDTALADRLGLDAPALRGYRAYLLSKDRKRLKSLPGIPPHLFADDVFALGNLPARHGLGKAVSMGRSQWGRTERPDQRTGPGKPTLREYHRLGMPFGEEELAYLEQNLEPLTVSGLDYDEKGRLQPASLTVTPDAMRAARLDHRLPGAEFPLPWTPGAAMYAMDPSALWYRKHDKHGVPLVAGISGTTTRMVSAMHWLRPPAGEDRQRMERQFFLAVVAWMLPTRDHSLYEILRGAKAAGLAGLADLPASSQDAVGMYRAFDAFLRETLPGTALPEPPHAQLYMDLAKAGPEDDGLITVDKRMVRAAGARRRKLDRQGRHPALTEPYLLALEQYTGGSHQLINRVLSWHALPTLGTRLLAGEMIGPLKEDQVAEIPFATWRDPELQRRIEAYTARDLDGVASKRQTKRLLDAIQSRMEALSERLSEEGQLHADMLAEALSHLPPVTGTVYRAAWEPFHQGPRHTFAPFASTSRDDEQALDFLPLQRPPVGGRRVLYHVSLTGRSGRDIAEFSKHPDEEEVLLLPGATFTETGRFKGLVKQIKGKDYTYDYVFLTETG